VPKDNAEIVRTLFEGAWRTEEWRELIAEDVVWDTSATEFPGAGVDHGHEGVLGFFRTWLGAWEDPQVELVEAREGTRGVFAFFRWTGRGRTSGVPVERDFWGVYELRDGRIVRYFQARTREEALEAAGFPGEGARAEPEGDA
jgi:ketosteroid isomerase-like protein